MSLYLDAVWRLPREQARPNHYLERLSQALLFLIHSKKLVVDSLNSRKSTILSGPRPPLILYIQFPLLGDGGMLG